jgi:hypothetical protein
MTRTDIINFLISKYNYKSYLEIGIGDGANYNLITCDYKTNVDPCFDSFDSQDLSHVKNKVTSDEFFDTNTETFDIIFIDGLHVYEQVYKDIQNSLKFLNEGGSIICHDMLPPTAWHQRPANEYQGGEWNGDCWKAVARLRVESDDLEIYTINSDWGVSVIRKGNNLKYPKDLDIVLDYSFFERNKFGLMNVINPNDIY